MTSKIPRKKRPKASNAFDMVSAGLPEEERELIKGLVEGDDEDDKSEYESIFEKAFGTLEASASNPDADFRSEQAAKNMQRAALALVLRMIPQAEVNYMHSKKQTDAYAMNAFIDQARELSNDLRMLSDADGQVEHITNRILKPLLLSAGQTLLAEITAIKNSIDTELSGNNKVAKVLKRKVDESAMSLGKFWREMQMAIEGQLNQYMHGGSKLDVPSSIQQKSRKKSKRRSGE